MVAALVGIMVGLGALGVVRGLTATAPSLEAVAATLDRAVGPASDAAESSNRLVRLRTSTLGWLDASPLSDHPRWPAWTSCLDITGVSAEQLVSQVFVAGGVALLGPPVAWALSRSLGSAVPVGVPIVLGLVALPLGAVTPVMIVIRRAGARRRHFRTVVSSFVDLVVLSLAGGVGVEGALLTASQISTDWASARMAKVLLRSRDSGQSPWAALGQLGEALGVPELEELSSTLQLAGTEGSRIRQSLSARAASLRRHDQAEAESSANAMTERLFLPGALLLIGFLLFVGYPAFSRILGGF
jgi:tight adherence protein C